MTGTANSLSLYPAAISAARAAARVEKIHRSNGLHEERGNGEARGQNPPRRASAPALSHSETQAASSWHGQRLSSPFVAQILGQVLAQGERDVAGARTAYEGAAGVPSGILFDASF